MLTDLKHLPVNWIDGMKIARRHFEETGNYIAEQVRDATARGLSEVNYGILAADPSLELKVFCDFSLQISVEVSACKGITPNGTRLEITPDMGVSIQANFRDLASKFGLQTTQPQQILVVLQADPFNRTPVGEVSVQENPPRHPYTRDTVTLDLVPAEYVVPGKLVSGLVVGKIAYVNGELLPQKEFIPCCASMSSLPLTRDWHNRFRTLAENWEQCCVRIIQKVNSKSQQQNTLTASILRLSEKLLEHLAYGKLHYRWVLPQESPVYTCEWLMSHIYYLFTLLQCYSERDREEMLAYFAEWGELQSGTIENQTVRALNVNYEHHDLQNVFNEIHLVYQLYVGIFQKLSQLEFIGKRKGQSVFVVEHRQEEVRPQAPSQNQPPPPPPPPPQEKKPTRWSPL